MPGEFELLLPFKWRDTEYPISRIRVSLAHDLAEHKAWRVDGARIEDTGLAPLRIAADMPLLNTIYPGVNESWTAGKLYPTALRQFFVDFAKKTDGYLQHPEFGRILCKAENVDVELESTRRGHAQVTASWVQTNSDDDPSVPDFSPFDTISQAAADLDGSEEDLRALAPTLPEYKTSFEDFARALTAVFDQAAIGPQRALARIDSIVYRAQELQRSIDKARSAQTWPATHAVHRILEAANILKLQVLASQKTLGIFPLPFDSTLAGAMRVIPESTRIADVIRLNPGLVARPIVPAGTAIRFYLAA